MCARYWSEEVNRQDAEVAKEGKKNITEGAETRR
jgi:hypothetical protein